MEQLINAAACLFETGEEGHTAIECGERTVSYGQLRQAVACAAGAWQSLGLASDERVVIYAPDSIEWVEAYLGAIWAGGVAIGVNPRLALEELGPILVESGVRLVWTTAELAPALLAWSARQQRPLLIAATGAAGCVDW
ncbi:MAG: AMP-binding protein, partial [Telluria sp.]